MRIAFLAMSGIRAWDQELLEMGLTMPGFVERSQAIASLPSLGLLTLAGMSQAHDCSYHDLENAQSITELDCQWDIAVISSFTAQIYEAYEVAAHCRKLGVKVIMGGLHVTSLPDEAQEHCDSIVIGEGESLWPQILKDYQNKKEKSRYDARPFSFDLKDAPMPAFELLDIEKYNRITIQTSRGCPHSCEFCAGSILLTSRYKQKPIDKVLAEIDAVLKIWPRPFIEFADDNSLVNKAYWQKLLPELKKRKIRWFVETDISLGQDPTFLKLLKDAGCTQVLIGLESPTDSGLDGLEERNNWKAKKIDSYHKNIKNIQAAGIRVNACFIIGLDGQDKTVFDAVYHFAEKASLFDIQVTLPTPFPGTPFYTRLKKEDRLLEEKAWHKTTLFDLLFTPDSMSYQELQQGFRTLIQKLYSDEFTKKRRSGYKALQSQRAPKKLPTNSIR